MNIKSSNNNIVSFLKKKVQAIPNANVVKIKPIEATPEISEKYATEIIEEALLQPSPKCIARNKTASELLKN